MIELKEEYGYEDFMKNYKVVSKYKTNNKLDDLVNMFAEIDAQYNAPGGQAQAQAPAQAPGQVK